MTGILTLPLGYVCTLLTSRLVPSLSKKVIDLCIVLVSVQGAYIPTFH